jgi:hypothetical protein
MADGGSAAAHRPGWVEDKSRGFAVGARNDEVEQAYREVEARDPAAWQGDVENYSAVKEGTACTVKNAE